MTLAESELCKRIIPCLDVRNGTTVKGVRFGNLRDVGDPIELALAYQEQGADELIFLDISAGSEKRTTMIHLVAAVADNLSIPFTVGGGVASIHNVKALLSNGVDKVSINTAAFLQPSLINEIAQACGSQCCVVAIDVRRAVGACSSTFNKKSRYIDSQVDHCWEVLIDHRWEVLINGGSTATGRDAFGWAAECVERGAGEILLTSWDKDGTLAGFDIDLVRTFSEGLPVPVIASGGACNAASFVEVFQQGKADAALAASIFHDGLYTVQCIKEELARTGIPVRLC